MSQASVFYYFNISWTVQIVSSTRIIKLEAVSLLKANIGICRIHISQSSTQWTGKSTTGCDTLSLEYPSSCTSSHHFTSAPFHVMPPPPLLFLCPLAPFHQSILVPQQKAKTYRKLLLWIPSVCQKFWDKKKPNKTNHKGNCIESNKRKRIVCASCVRHNALFLVCLIYLLSNYTTESFNIVFKFNLNSTYVLCCV